MKQFQPFRLDVRNQALWKGTERLSLMPKPFAVLTHLVEHAGRLVTQDELLAAVWPDTFVQPEVLRKHILEIRRVLDDRADEPRFVETLPKRGYTFIAPVTDLDPSAEPKRSRTPDATPAIVRLPGRAREQAALHSALSAAVEGARAVVFVTGEAGIGKTTLIDAWQRSVAADARAILMRGQAVEGFAGKEPYYPVLDALSQIARTTDGRSLADALATYAPAWLAQMPALASAERRQDRSRELAGTTREGMVREICEALEAWSESRALVLVIEDLHWADRSTLDVVSALARRRQPARLLVVATYRPADVIVSESPLKSLKQDLLLHGLCQELVLERLAASEVRVHLSTAFGALPEAFSEAIHRHSDGNPLFMTALLAHLVRQGALEQRGSQWHLTADPGRMVFEIPDTLKQLLKARIDVLAPIEQRVLEAASVCGTSFSVWAVQAILGQDDAGAEDACARLCDGPELLHEIDGPPGSQALEGPSYEFSHALYREILYRRLPAGERIQAHRRLAEALARHANGSADAHATALAEHFEKGHDFTSAVRYATHSAQLAAHRLAHAEAIATAEHALDLLPRVDPVARPALELGLANRLGDSAYALGDAVRSAEAYRRAAAAAEQQGAPIEHADALFRLAGPTALFDPDAAIAACERAVTLGQSARNPIIEHRGRLLAAAWRILFHGWRAEDSAACRTSAAELRRHGLDPLPAHDLMLLAHVQFIQSEYADAALSAHVGLDTLTERDALWECVAGMTAEAVASTYLGRYGLAFERLQQGLEIARRNGNHPWQGILQGVVASLHLHTCDYAGTKAIANAILAALGGAPFHQITVNMLFTRGFAELWTGEVSQARASFQAALDEGAGTLFPLHWYFRMFARLGLADVALQEGKTADAQRECDRLLPLAAACRDAAIQALAWELQARIALATGDLTLGSHSINRALAALEPGEVPMAAWRVHDTARRTYARAGDDGRAARHRQRAAAILDQIAATLDPCPQLRESLFKDSRVREIVSGAGF